MSDSVALSFAIPQDRIDTLVKNVMQNYPEYSSPSLVCVEFNYNDCLYTFHDYDDDGTVTKHVVDLSSLRKGFMKLIELRTAGKANFYGWNVEPLLGDEDAWADWPCDWDANVVDGLVQCALFDDIIYG